MKVVARNVLFVLACAAGLAVNAFIYKPGLGYDPNRDFLGLYPGGRLAGSSRLYDAASIVRVQRESAGLTNPRRLFIRPPFYAILLWPLARLPYPIAFGVFEFAMLVAAGVFLWLWTIPDRKTTILACCWSMPLFGSFAIAQDVPIPLAVIAVSYTLLRRKRDLAAGMVFSLCAIKPHLFLLIPIFVIARRMWRFGAGMAVGGVGLIGLCFAGAGPNWLPAFLNTATRRDTSLGINLMTNLRGLFNDNLRLEIAAGIVVAVLLWFVATRSSLEWSLAATLACGMLTSHHAYAADCAVLLPAVLIVLGQSRADWQRAIGLCLLVPVTYAAVFLGPAGLLTRILLIAFAASFAAIPREAAMLGSRNLGGGSIYGSGREVQRIGASDGAAARSGWLPVGSQADL